MFRTNYAGHDQVYRQLQVAGLVGWDKTAEAYEERFQQLARVFQDGPAPRHGRLLELGCGAGNVTLWLAEKGYQVTGVDISPTAVAWARQKAREGGLDAAFLEGDVRELAALVEAPFDVVLDGHCLHCIVGEDRARVLAEVRRVLRPGGYFFIDTMCGPVAPGHFKGYDEPSRCTVFDGVATRYFGLAEDILEELTSAGFQVLSHHVEPDTTHSMLTAGLTRS